MTLDTTTTPALTGTCAYDTYTLTAGAVTIDLTALKQVNNLALDLSSPASKPRIVKIKNISTHRILVSKGASNGYSPVVGDAFNLPIPAGGEATIYDGGNGAAVDATHKTLDVVGTLTDSFQVVVINGP
jgi:hypothetical protein